MFSVACFIQSSALLAAFFSPVTLQDSWLAVVFGSAFGLLLVWLYSAFMAAFPGKNLLQVADAAFGTVLGKAVGGLYVWFFVTMAALNIADLGNFTKLMIMEETPNVVLMLACVLISAWAVRHGIEVVTRYSSVFWFVTLGLIGMSIILVLNQIRPENFFPMFDLPFIKYVQGTHIYTMTPIGELVVFLMLAPNVRLTRRRLTRFFFQGFAFGGITFLIVLLRDVAVLGSVLDLFAMPGLVTLRLVNMGTAFSRMEIIFAVMRIMLLFFKITLLYYVSVIAIAQITGVKAYRFLTLSVGAFMTAYGLTLYPGPMEHIASAQKTVPFIWILFEILLPLLTFVTAKARKPSEQGEV
jgi:spore germination protein KB